MLVFSILHNFFYALAIVFENIIMLEYIFEFLHASSLRIPVIVCPISAFVGAVGISAYLKLGRRQTSCFCLFLP